MKTLEYERYKIKREIETHGDFYTVFRKKVDKRGETVEGMDEISMIHGLYHVVKGYVSDKRSNATHTHSKGEPKILAMKEEMESIQRNDIICINSKLYTVVEINDISEYNIACDISLEAVVDGR